MNSVVATTLSAVYLAVRHIFPDTPLNAGAFEPLIDHAASTARSSMRKYPRPVSGCAAEVSQRIAEAVFLALAAGDPGQGHGGAGRHDPATSASAASIPRPAPAT